jgi:hypothetical protein
MAVESIWLLSPLILSSCPCDCGVNMAVDSIFPSSPGVKMAVSIWLSSLNNRRVKIALISIMSVESNGHTQAPLKQMIFLHFFSVKNTISYLDNGQFTPKNVFSYGLHRREYKNVFNSIHVFVIIFNCCLHCIIFLPRLLIKCHLTARWLPIFSRYF